MIYEIRNYYFKPEHFEAYKRWASDQALPYIKENLNLIGFWVNTDAPVEVTGEEMDQLGSANITWILGWDTLDQRNDTMGKVFGSDEWSGIFEHVPGGLPSYLRMEAKFTEQLA